MNAPKKLFAAPHPAMAAAKRKSTLAHHQSRALMLFILLRDTQTLDF
jgi:hypothetical protein